VVLGAVGGTDARPTVAVVGVVWIGVNAVVLSRASSDLAVGIVIAQMVALVGGALVLAAARRTETPAVVRIIALAWVAKLFGTLARFYVLQVTYDGRGDANAYADAGTVLAERFRHGDIGPLSNTKNLLGTQLVEMATGGLFSVTGRTVIGGFYVFSAIGFVGIYLTFRALRMTLPDADPVRLALLGFLLPSMVFWPSSIGKEALMVLAIGLTLYGASRWWAGLAWSFAPLAAGLVASALVRPHVTVLLGTGLVGAIIIVRAAPSPGALLVKLARTGVFLGGLALAVALSSSFFKLDEVDADGVNSVLERAEDRSDSGGSGYETVNPVLFPVAAVTVLYRPFPFEAGNLQTMIASAEGSVLLILTWSRRRHLVALIAQARERPVVAFTLVYGAMFVFAFSQFANFGLLARQRVQLYPLLVGLLCVDAASARARHRGREAVDVRTLAAVP
jgi:hypothetical protein